MIRLPVIAAALILPRLVLAQPTDDAARCQVAAGSYLTGTIVSGPRFKPGAPLHGTYLSHTHLILRWPHCRTSQLRAPRRPERTARATNWATSRLQ